MIGRLVQAADFKRLLSVPPAHRSVHFVIHHLAEAPVRRVFGQAPAGCQELSTGHEPIGPQAVDDTPGKPHQGSHEAPAGPPGSACWLGCVVPKRHARRAVTRNLLKRQMMAAAHRAQTRLANGMWLVRLRQSFGVKEFPSAASDALRAAARAELDQLFLKATRRRPPSAQPSAGAPA